MFKSTRESPVSIFSHQTGDKGVFINIVKGMQIIEKRFNYSRKKSFTPKMSAPIKTFVVNHCIHTENPLHNPRKRLVFTGKYNQVNMISHDYIVVNREFIPLPGLT